MEAATSDGDGRRQRAAVDGGSGRRSVAETGPKQRKQGKAEEGKPRGGWRRWTPAGVTVEAAGSGGAAG